MILKIFPYNLNAGSQIGGVVPKEQSSFTLGSCSLHGDSQQISIQVDLKNPLKLFLNGYVKMF